MASSKAVLEQLCTDLRDSYADIKSAANDFEKLCSAKIAESVWFDLLKAKTNCTKRTPEKTLKRVDFCLNNFSVSVCPETNKVYL